ncbi:reverse transcriptase [Trichonephila clavipes]|nr:reverse transcriptase [Trichonephila clavipes]
MENSGLCRFNLETPGESRGCCTLSPNHRQDFLEVYLHWIGLAADEACPLCSHVRMDGDHLLQCTRLDEYPTDVIVSRYWEARPQIVKKRSTGVG